MSTNMKKSRLKRSLLLVTLASVGLLGCELIVDFDRTRIPVVLTEAGTPEAGSTPDAAEPGDASDDAGDESDASDAGDASDAPDDVVDAADQ